MEFGYGLQLLVRMGRNLSRDQPQTCCKGGRELCCPDDEDDILQWLGSNDLRVSKPQDVGESMYMFWARGRCSFFCTLKIQTNE